MKACNNCGTPLNEGSSFCTNCGTSVSAIAKEPVSVGGWIGRSLIPFIPVVGGIVYLIMLFIWSGDT